MQIDSALATFVRQQRGGTGEFPARIAVIGNAMPRRCGIATYTSHSVSAMAAAYPDLIIDHYAVDDGHGDISYPDSIHTITQNDRSAYIDAAEAIGDAGTMAIWVQHEFGIFGGAAGDFLLDLLRRTALPLVVTLHTVLSAPNADEERVMRAIIDRADRLVVMADHGKTILIDRYGVDAATIAVIPHGVPDRALIDASEAKAKVGLPQRPTVMTFGLLAPSKGIDTMIAALPAILDAQPATLYYVLGATHPAVKRKHGETYRAGLIAQAEALGVADAVRFDDRFFDDDDLLDWLQAADVYATPYDNPQQVTSGALSYAVAMGRPVVATPYVHACEILADGVGTIVDFADVDGFATAISGLLGDDRMRRAASERTWRVGRSMIWSANAAAMTTEIATAIAAQPVPIRVADRTAGGGVLSVDLAAVERMTDGVGIFQHGIFQVPDRAHGYCIDDNARALILACRCGLGYQDRALALATTYAAFIQHAWNPDSRRFRNFMGYSRNWLESVGSDDSNGRAIWALGVAAAEAPTQSLRQWALQLLVEAMPIAEDFTSPRATAFMMLGADALLQARPGDGAGRTILARGAALLSGLVTTSRRTEWPWFEAVLAYDNARLPEALLRAGRALGDSAITALGLETLDWIVSQQTSQRGHFRAVGTDSFGSRYALPRRFDQQPLEAAATVDACLVAADVTGDRRWLDAAKCAHDWFLGGNDLALSLASAGDGGCYDGLSPQGVNRNQGAESILALQMATCAMQQVRGKASDNDRQRVST